MLPLQSPPSRPTTTLRRQLRRLRRAALPVLLALTAVSLIAAHRWAAQSPLGGPAGPPCSDPPDARPATNGASLLAWRHVGSSGTSRPLPTAHAHNDFEHERPLRDALAHGFTSVEVDVWLVGGQVLVGHDRDDVTRDRSLERLYLAPLEALRKSRGTVYPDWDGRFQLLVDVKSRARATYAALETALGHHPRLMTSSTAGRTEHRAVTAVVSGNKAPTAMQAERTRYASLDGDADQPHDRAPTTFMPLVSTDWSEEFTWDGTCAMPAAEERRLRELVATAHQNGQRIRFWDTPDQPGAARQAVWRKLVEVGVDHIVTDDLTGLQSFLAGLAAERSGQARRAAASTAQ